MKKLLPLVLIILTAACERSAPVGSTAPATSPTGGAASASGYDAVHPPIVEVAGGKLRGFMNNGTFAFLGIQYATAARFEAPQPVPAWDGVKDAQAYGAICPIPEQTAVGTDEFVWPHRYWIQNENCQFLNLWTQQLDAAAKKPIMVFLHGGGFTNGSSIEAFAYDGKNLSEFGDVVVVTLNHRLNVLGSLNLSAYGDEFEKTGNMGMADIEAALRWLHDNAETFGGDPDNVTIFGQSGGSGKVVHLMHMPSAEGLFHRGIAESSGSFAYLTAEESARIAALTLQELGLDASQAEVLKTIPYPELLRAATAALQQVNAEVPERNLNWRPVLDGNYIESEYSEFSREMPFIVGTNFSERTSTFVLGDGRKNEWTEDETRANLAARFGAENLDELLAEFKALFPHKKPADAYFFDARYRVTVRESLDLRLSQSSGPVYNYLFAYEAPANGGIMPFHCAELIYVFHNVDMPEIKIATGADASTYAMQDTAAQAWVNFARTGNPSVDGAEWRPYTKEGHGTMVLDVHSEWSELDDRRLVELTTL
ncbi:MAG: carboxylesterase family protein [Gammaproteobacteria bacterium]|nr:carboxylesterase family protein [Gammaproteobacteria bacterium]MDH5304464.1 carboxylesterase family protein [Gammaproteobacteria bacterium]MDH5321708.1 carboxylesterase family protein [Gammaproteobacteria bacterium]